MCILYSGPSMLDQIHLVSVASKICYFIDVKNIDQKEKVWADITPIYVQPRFCLLRIPF